MMKPYRFVFLLLPLCLLLTGCSLGLFAAKSGSTNVSVGSTIDDLSTQYKVQMLIYDIEKAHPNAYLEGVTFNRKTIVAGSLPSAKIKQTFVKDLKAIKEIGAIYDYIKINSKKPKISYWADSMITLKTKAEIWHDDNSMHYKVFTFNHKVYLIGRCPEVKCNAVLHRVAHVNGVKAVINGLTIVPPHFPKAVIRSISLTGKARYTAQS